MGRRTRARQRQRRFASTAAPVPVERPSVEPARPRFGRAGALSRATGQPSQALLRAGATEYAYVVKDFKRIGITAGAMLAILAVASIAASTLLK